MLGSKILLVLSVAAYANSVTIDPKHAVSQMLYCPSPNGVFPVPSDNCNQYILCNEGKPTVMSCLAGLAFNPKNNWCDLPQNVQCNSNAALAPATPASYSPRVTATPAPYSPRVSATPAPYSPSVPATPAPYSPRVTATPAPYSARVSATPAPYSPRVPVTPAPYSPPAQTKNPASPPRILQLASTPVRPPFAASDAALLPALGIPVEFNCQQSNGYYAIDNECDTYIHCQDNVAYKAECPDGLHFNPEAKYPDYACDYAPKVQCRGGAVEQIPKATSDCPRQYGFFPVDDGECSRYKRCHAGVLTIMECPAGLVFNPKDNACDWKENVPDCKPNAFKNISCPDTPLESLSDDIFKYRYQNECSRFILCSKGFPRLLSCAAGESFDDASQSCVDSAYVENCQPDKYNN